MQYNPDSTNGKPPISTLRTRNDEDHNGEVGIKSEMRL